MIPPINTARSVPVSTFPATSARAPASTPDDTVQKLRDHAALGLAAERRGLDAIPNLWHWPPDVLIQVHTEGEPVVSHGHSECPQLLEHVNVWRSSDGHYLALPLDAAPPKPCIGHGVDSNSLFDAVLTALQQYDGVVHQRFTDALRPKGAGGTDAQWLRQAVAENLECDNTKGGDGTLGELLARGVGEVMRFLAHEPSLLQWTPEQAFASTVQHLNSHVLQAFIGPDASNGPTSPPPAAPPSCDGEALRAQTLAHQVRAGIWDGPAGDLAAPFIPCVEGWPARALMVHTPTGAYAFGESASDQAPVEIAWTPNHYSARLNGKTVPVRGNGNCFFVATILAMGPGDRASFGPDDETASLGLQEALAHFMETNPQRIAQWMAPETHGHGVTAEPPRNAAGPARTPPPAIASPPRAQPASTPWKTLVWPKQSSR